MSNCKFSASRVAKDGKPAMRFEVSGTVPAMRDVCRAAGMALVEGVSNCYAIVVTNAQEAGIVQAAMRPHFDAQANYIG